MINAFDGIERQELIKKLIDNGYGPLIEVLLSGHGRIYTKKSRLNKSCTCRALGWKPKQLEEAIRECKALLPELEE